MSPEQEQVDQRYHECIERFAKGGVDGGRNPDGTPKPAEIHFGDALVYDTADLVSFNNALPSQLKVCLSKAAAAYLVFGEESNSMRKEKIELNFNKDFNFISLRAFLPGMRLGWHDYDFQLGSRRCDRTMIMSAVGAYNVDAAYSVRVGEGCDRCGNSFPDDEPVEGTRNYAQRKDLREQYRANTLPYGEYMIKLQKVFQDRSPDREPLTISRGEIRDDGNQPSQCAFIDFKGVQRADQLAQYKIEPTEFPETAQINLQLVFRRLVPIDEPQGAPA